MTKRVVFEKTKRVSSMKRVWILLGLAGFVSMLIAVAPANAQKLVDGVKNVELLRMGLYPPDLIMRHQQTLGISDAQRKSITTLVRDFQSDVADLQWNLQNNQQILGQALNEHPVNTQTTLDQSEKVLKLESEFKLAHFRLLIGIKNVLKTEQVELIEKTLKQRRRNGKL